MFKKRHSEEFYQKIVAANLKTPTNTAIGLQGDELQLDYRGTRKKLDRFVGKEENPGRQSEIVKAEVPAALLEVFRDSGHALFLDEPERFNALLDDFLGFPVQK